VEQNLFTIGVLIAVLPTGTILLYESSTEGVSQKHNIEMLDKYKAVTKDEVIRLLKTLFSKLF